MLWQRLFSSSFIWVYFQTENNECERSENGKQAGVQASGLFTLENRLLRGSSCAIKGDCHTASSPPLGPEIKSDLFQLEGNNSFRELTSLIESSVGPLSAARQSGGGGALGSGSRRRWSRGSGHGHATARAYARSLRRRSQRFIYHRTESWQRSHRQAPLLSSFYRQENRGGEFGSAMNGGAEIRTQGRPTVAENYTRS